jgi:hypothetical protein
MMGICKDGCCINCRALKEQEATREFYALNPARPKNSDDIMAATSEMIRQRINEYSLARKICGLHNLTQGEPPSYPVDEQTFTKPAWILPGLGYVAQEVFELGADEIHVPLLSIAAAKDWMLRYVEENRTDIFIKAIDMTARALVCYEEEALWRLLIPMATAGFGGAGVVPGYTAPIVKSSSGHITLDLLKSMSKIIQGYGKKLKTLLVSPEDFAEIEELFSVKVNATTGQRYINFYEEDESDHWDIEVFEVNDLGMKGKFNVNGNASEWGPFRGSPESNSFNDYHIESPNIFDENGNLVRAGETQIYGLSEDVRDYIRMPIKEEYTAHNDPTLLRRQKVGFFGWATVGFGCLDPSCIVMGAIDRQGQEEQEKKEQ